MNPINLYVNLNKCQKISTSKESCYDFNLLNRFLNLKIDGIYLFQVAIFDFRTKMKSEFLFSLKLKMSSLKCLLIDTWSVNFVSYLEIRKHPYMIKYLNFRLKTAASKLGNLLLLEDSATFSFISSKQHYGSLKFNFFFIHLFPIH